MTVTSHWRVDLIENQKITLGFVVSGEQYSEMSILSFYSLLKSLHCVAPKNHSLNKFISQILIVTDDTNLSFVSFVRLWHSNVTVIKPSQWEKLLVPPMVNGSFATYYKFDLMEACSQDDSILFYLDTDAFVVGDINIQFLLDRLGNVRDQNSILMVPSHRPVLERTGYTRFTSPYAYFNAGFIFQKLNRPFEISQIIEHLKIFYPSGGESLIWHDQDLINSYFGEEIKPLPLRWNISTGMLREHYFAAEKLNYLAIEEFLNPVIIHASGSVLTKLKKHYYPYREKILEVLDLALNEPMLKESHLQSLRNFQKRILLSRKERAVIGLRTFFGLTPECSRRIYADQIYWKMRLKRVKQKLSSSSN